MAKEVTDGVTAVVAAYNEADRIGLVLGVLTSYPGFAEVIVVDDGSTDDTTGAVSGYDVLLLRVEPNRGKGHAMDIGVDAASSPVIFFADADIIGLTHDMIADTVRPVVEGTCEMFVLMRNRRVYWLRTIMNFIPLLGGERALTKALWLQLPTRYKDRFRIEAGLNFYAIHYGAGLKYRVFPGITQTVKEAKFGFLEGLRRRIAMARDVVAAAWDLQWNDLPPTAASHRRAATRVALSVFGMLVGVLVLAGGVAGPVGFFTSLFSNELRQDPGAPVATFLLRAVSGLSATAVLAIGAVVLALNLAFFALGLVRIITADRIRSEG